MSDEILVIPVFLVVFLIFQWFMYVVLSRSLNGRIDGIHQRLDHLSGDFNTRIDNVNYRLDTLIGRPILVQPGPETGMTPSEEMS